MLGAIVAGPKAASDVAYDLQYGHLWRGAVLNPGSFGLMGKYVGVESWAGGGGHFDPTFVEGISRSFSIGRRPEYRAHQKKMPGLSEKISRQNSKGGTVNAYHRKQPRAAMKAKG